MGKVILVCGKICSGKSYYSKQIKESLNAVIISPDEATYELINNEQGEFYNVFSQRLNKYLTRKVGEIAKAGANVIFERGLWSSKDRKDIREYYKNNGIDCEIHYVCVDDETWKQNIKERNKKVLDGNGGSDFYLDEGLMKKLELKWEEPTKEEYDILYKVDRKSKKNKEVIVMQEIIDKIVQQNSDLFGLNPMIEKINVGFTNTIYKINDSFIVKICTNSDNEKKFIKEIEFYKANRDNNLIPKLDYSSIDKKNIPYFYEIIEKVEGVSLYNVWHTFSEEQREDLIKQLCEAMRQIHSNIGSAYDWTKDIKDQFTSLYTQAKNLNIFNEEEQKLLDYAFSKFEKYLDSKDFVLIHNDLHFDNIFYNDGKIKLIDFERSMYAPRDFELDILYRMIRKPWKFASEETEQYTDSSDYTNIMLYIEKYYSELVNIPNLYQRLAIYDMVYFLAHLVKHPELEELKNDVVFGAKIVALKDEMTFNDVKTSKELMDFMNINIGYGWIDKYGDKHLNNLKGFRENYRISSIDEMLETGLGTCIEQAKMIKLFFDKMGIENKLYCHRSYETEENFDKEVRMHCFVLFKYNDNWYHFEHSNRPKRGIHKYKSTEEAIKKITSGFEEHGDIRKLTEIDSIPDGLTFKEFNQFVNEFDTMKSKTM